MQDVVRQSGRFISEKFIVCRVAKVVEGRQVRRAVAMATGAVDDRVDALAIRCLVRPRHELAAYINRATAVERKTCCRAAVESPRVRSTRSAYIVCALDVANCWMSPVLTAKSSAISTPSIFMLQLRVIPGSGSGSTTCSCGLFSRFCDPLRRYQVPREPLHRGR